MDARNFALAESLVGAAYIRQGKEARHSREALVRALLSHRKLPEEGWDDQSIELFLQDLALMDSNNFRGNVGVGEREGRVISALVAARNRHFGHGIGRSGDIAAVQPKAAGSSLMQQLCTLLCLHAVRLSGITSTSSCLILPTATGMAITLTLLALRQHRPADAKFIIWPRMDQKSCLKAILTAGLTPLVVENLLEGDELRTDLSTIESLIKQYGPDSIVAVVTTTSCFAPRAPDRVEEVAVLCAKYEVPHLINNAYGLQCSKTTHMIDAACRNGRVDAFIQSTDKNFLVPVGGAIVAAPKKWLVDEVSKVYPGRASAAPLIDVFITLLSLGESGYKDLLKQRKELLPYFMSQMGQLAGQYGERILHTPHNRISVAISMEFLMHCGPKDPTFLGSMLFSRRCSGTRIIIPSPEKRIAGSLHFSCYGAHFSSLAVPYMTTACALGMKKEEVDVFVQRFHQAVTDYRKHSSLSPSPFDSHLPLSDQEALESSQQSDQQSNQHVNLCT